MSISPQYAANDLLKLLKDESTAIDWSQEKNEIAKLIKDENREGLAKVIRQVEKAIRSRASTLPYPENSRLGLDPPHRELIVCLNYLIGIANELEKQDSNHSTSSLSLHAFASCVGIIAGLLDHLSQQNYNP